MSSADEKPDAAPRITLAGALLALAFGLVLLVGLAEIGLRLGYPSWREFDSARFMAEVDVPGHGRVDVGRAGFDGWFAQNNGDFRARIRINAFGLRDPEPVAAADGRIWVIGDSMTFGWGVGIDETFSTIIAHESGKPTYNVASPGTNVCGYQALVARMPRAVRPAAAIVGLVLENDMHRYDCARGKARAADAARPAGSEFSLLAFKQGLMRHSALYNVIALSLKRVPAVTDALMRLGLVAREHAYKPPDTDEKSLDALTTSTVEELAYLRGMLPPGTPFAVLIVPARFEIRSNDDGYRALRQKTVAALAARGIAAIDPIEGFRAAGFTPTHFAHDGHWSPPGHRIAGKEAAKWLAGAAR
jgi:hypothetical protein